MKAGLAIYPNVEAFRKAIAALPDGEYLNKIERQFKKRTNPLNRYYWGVILEIVLQGLQDLGHDVETKEDAHAIVKKLFIKRKSRRKRLVNKQTGEYMYIQNDRSTKQMTTVEFIEYFEKIIRWAAEFLNIVIPDPDPELRKYRNETH